MSSEIKDIQYNQIRKIKVQSLFGLFDYTIPLNDCGVTILIGVNGCGKSTIFKILHSILKTDFYNILDVDFKLFEIYFENGDFVKCEKIVKNRNVNDLSLNVARNKRLVNHENFSNGVQKLWNQSKLLQDFVITVESKGSSSRHQLILLKENSGKKEITYVANEITTELKIILNELGTKSRFINTQRLQLNDLGMDDLGIEQLEKKYRIQRTRRVQETFFDDFNISTYKSRIQEYASDLSKVIKSERSNYFAESQDVEKKTLFEYLSKTNVKNKRQFIKNELGDVENDISRMNKHMSKLLKLGIYKQGEMSHISDSNILDGTLNDLKKYIENTSKKESYSTMELNGLLDFFLKSSLLKSYAENMRKKLDIFEDLESKVEIFMNHINNLFEYKEMEVDLEKGFVFKLKNGLEKGRIIDPIDLSSGEQHEVILNYELIFKTENNSVILIDEPEISLHILWQKKFIDNLLEIAKENSLNIIVATHSPDIVHKHRNLVCVLSEI